MHSGADPHPLMMLSFFRIIELKHEPPCVVTVKVVFVVRAIADKTQFQVEIKSLNIRTHQPGSDQAIL